MEPHSQCAQSACLQVFICGPSPHWLLVTGRGALRLHPMGIDGPIDSFAPFHNVNCPRGFLYFNRQVRRLGLQLWEQRAKVVEMAGAEELNCGLACDNRMGQWGAGCCGRDH